MAFEARRRGADLHSEAIFFLLKIEAHFLETTLKHQNPQKNLSINGHKRHSRKS